MRCDFTPMEIAEIVLTQHEIFRLSFFIQTLYDIIAHDFTPVPKKAPHCTSIQRALVPYHTLLMQLQVLQPHVRDC